jgi:energy-coupling factor transporter transmembrane protein EcfT
MKVRWISKAWKITFWVIVWIIIWIFAIIWFFSVKIFYTQLQNEHQWLSYWFASADEMLENIMNNFGYSQWWLMSNYKFNLFGQNFFAKDDDDTIVSFTEMVFGDINWKTIEIDDDFTWAEINDTRVYLVIPYDSKFTNDFWEWIYWDEVNERWDKIRIWNKIHELKIELTNARNFHWMIVKNNSKHEHFREKSIWFNWFNRYVNSTEDIKPWETACIILTSLNPITQTDISLHDEWCEFWHLEREAWYDEILLEFGTLRYMDWDVSPEIKITPISIDVPIFTNYGNTSR